MGKKPRELAAGLCYHIRSQCNNKEYRFETDDDFQDYLNLLHKAKKKFDFKIHAYNLMHTHTHLIATTPGPVLLDKIMYFINKRYSDLYNLKHNMIGHFWMGPYRCDVIDTDQYAITCMRYLDRNPIRAGFVKVPEEWKWSSYKYYSMGASDKLITPLPTYLGIDAAPQKRQKKYADFVLSIFPADEARDQKQIRNGLQRKRSNKKRK